MTQRTSSMAPEVAHGDPGDSRSDVFSLGIVLRELFVGPRFPRTMTNAEAVRLAREGFVQSISFQPNLPDAVVQVIARSLRFDPADRYPNASALAFDLRRIAMGMGVGDGRTFLRRALEREWGNDVEVTTEHRYSTAPPEPKRPVGPDDLQDLEGLPTIADLEEALLAGRADNDDVVDADLVEEW